MQPITATYRDGVFAPENPVAIPEGTRVNLVIVPVAEDAESLSEEDREFLRELADKRKSVFQRLAE
jgi:predicted DNA-binding antitoxin AbrB/MazE fold protein